jgi:DNA-binding NarL/FixJ family response regulator
MKDSVQTEEAPRIEISSQISNAAGKALQKRTLRILHVDADPCFLDVSKQILSMEPYFEVDTAISVDEALEKMEKQTYDVVVSDYEMPLRNGLDFLKELREQGKDVPFILFTGKGREEVVVKALNLGADRYINKYGSPETRHSKDVMLALKKDGFVGNPLTLMSEWIAQTIQRNMDSLPFASFFNQTLS